jgi:hypothetical protein
MSPSPKDIYFPVYLVFEVYGKETTRFVNQLEISKIYWPHCAA